MVDKHYQKRLERAKEKKAHPDFIADMEFLSQINGSYNRKQKAVREFMEFYRVLVEETDEDPDKALEITLHKAMANAYHEIIRYVKAQKSTTTSKKKSGHNYRKKKSTEFNHLGTLH